MSSAVWKQVSVRVPPHSEDAVADFLTTLTGRGVRIEEADGGSVVEAYLGPGENADLTPRIEAYLEDLVRLGRMEEAVWTAREIPEEDWMSVFRSQHDTVRVSPRLVVRPTWRDPSGTREIVLDPGMAFGTGGHATTRMCLELLDEAVGNPPPGSMLDLGSGSGILAIAGACLGIPRILAVDIDPVAVQTTRENAALNGVADRIEVREGGIGDVSGLFDLAAANISASLLIRLAGRIADRVAPGGRLILSGILEDETGEVLEAFEGAGLSREKVLIEKVWVAVLMGRSAP